MQIKIKSRWNDSVIFEGEFESLLLAVEEAVRKKANLVDAYLVDANLRGANLVGANLVDAYLVGVNLRGANLRDANLRGANLVGANLVDAYLVGANLRGANLVGANLVDAYLGGAYLVGANLRGAYLVGANLVDAYLVDANLRGANLVGANLVDAYLGDVNLDPFRTDLFDVLLRAPREVGALRLALSEGRVDGNVYEGECACLVGTIANARGANHRELGALRPDSGRPAEQWFMSIKKGDTPDKNQVVAITIGWIDEFVKLLDAARVAA